MACCLKDACTAYSPEYKLRMEAGARQNLETRRLKGSWCIVVCSEGAPARQALPGRKALSPLRVLAMQAPHAIKSLTHPADLCGAFKAKEYNTTAYYSTKGFTIGPNMTIQVGAGEYRVNALRRAAYCKTLWTGCPMVFMRSKPGRVTLQARGTRQASGVFRAMLLWRLAVEGR